MSEDKEFLKVRAIKDGTVIDHINPRVIFKVINLLGLENIDNEIVFGTNLTSRRMGRKGIIKVVDRYFSEDELSYLALVAPTARVSTIKNFEVVDKHQIHPPKEVIGYVSCANPMCVTNKENVPTRFTVTVGDSGELSLKCHYCEKETHIDNIEIIK